MIKFTPTQWQQILGFTILDPDGWDRRGDKFDADWSRPLTLNEFLDKSDVSTCSRRPSREACRQLALTYISNAL